MDCAAICLLTAAVQFVPLSSTVNCTYCVEARSTYEHCFKDVIECAYRDPSSLIICLNVYEKNGGDPAIVQHTIRCISYQDYYVADESIRQVSAGGSCAFEHIQKCECDVCRSPTTTSTTTTTTQITPSMHRKKHHHHHHHKDGSNHNRNHDQLVYPNNTFAEKFRNSGLYLNSSENERTLSAVFIALVFCFLNVIN